MDLKSKFNITKASIGEDSQKKLEENWPKIQTLLKETLGSAALAAAKDDQTMTSLLKVVHEALPFPLRMLVKQEIFVQYCLVHRDQLIAQSA
jgi:hypothetical protein